MLLKDKHVFPNIHKIKSCEISSQFLSKDH
jgi:hypothetical protein